MKSKNFSFQKNKEGIYETKSKQTDFEMNEIRAATEKDRAILKEMEMKEAG